MTGAARAALAFILALGALPTLLFGMLVGFGELSLLPGLIAWGICITVAVGFGILLGRDIILLRALVRGLRLNQDIPEMPLLVPGMRALGQEAVLLLRAERQDRRKMHDNAVEDRALVERLPDPLLKLDGAGNLVWRNATAGRPGGSRADRSARPPQHRHRRPGAARPGYHGDSGWRTGLCADHGPHERAQHRKNAGGFRRQRQPRAAHAAGQPDRLHRNPARPGGGRF
jgi:hypothetical protein